MEEFAKDVAFSEGLLTEWLKNSPPAIKDALKVIVEGVNYWRNQAYKEAEMKLDFSNKLNELTVLSSQYLAKISQQDEELTIRDIEEQQPVHQQINEALGNRRRARGFVDIE